MEDRGYGAEKGLKFRIGHLLAWIGKAEARSVRECEAYCLFKFGLTPSKTQLYLLWLEKYGKIEFTTVAKTVVRAL